MPSHLEGKQHCFHSWSQGSSCLGVAVLLPLELYTLWELTAMPDPFQQTAEVLPGTGLSFTARRQQMGCGFLYSVDYLGGFYEGTSVQDLHSHNHKYDYGCMILFPVTTETCSRDRGEQKQQIPSLPCSGDISCTKLQQTLCLPCSFFCSSLSSEGKCQVLLREQEPSE